MVSSPISLSMAGAGDGVSAKADAPVAENTLLANSNGSAAESVQLANDLNVAQLSAEPIFAEQLFAEQLDDAQLDGEAQIADSVTDSIVDDREQDSNRDQAQPEPNAEAWLMAMLDQQQVQLQARELPQAVPLAAKTIESVQAVMPRVMTASNTEQVRPYTSETNRVGVHSVAAVVLPVASVAQGVEPVAQGGDSAAQEAESVTQDRVRIAQTGGAVTSSVEPIAQGAAVQSVQNLEPVTKSDKPASQRVVPVTQVFESISKYVIPSDQQTKAENISREKADFSANNYSDIRTLPNTSSLQEHRVSGLGHNPLLTQGAAVNANQTTAAHAPVDSASVPLTAVSSQLTTTNPTQHIQVPIDASGVGSLAPVHAAADDSVSRTGLQTQLSLQSPEAKWGEQMLHALRENVQVQIQKNIQNATIRLDPPELGSLEIFLSHEAGRLTVHINASQADVARMIQNTSERLRQELAGPQFTHVNVQTSSDGQSGQQQSRARQQQMADEMILANEQPQPTSSLNRARGSDLLVTV